MNTTEARALVADHLGRYRALSYAELSARIDSVETDEVTGSSGTAYQIEIQFFWDDKLHRDVRVMAAIDDGGIRAFMPLTDSFIMAPDGSFVGE